MDRRQFGDLLRSTLGREEKSHKEIAESVGETSENTVKTWLDGTSQPGFFKGLRLAASTPALAKEVVRLIAMEADQDPEFQRDLLMFIQKWKAR